MRAVLDRFVRWIARSAVRGYFRTVEVEGVERVPSDRPVLVVAGHLAGFVDPALLEAIFPRPLRFLAMAKLWRYVFVRPFLWLAGVVPVHRASEGSTAPNVRTFSACHELLRSGGALAIFPEGVAHDGVRLLPLKTGAARIALGARRAGVHGVTIVPVGLIYEFKDVARSRAFVRVGEPIHLDAEIGRFVVAGEPEGDENRPAVARLTEEIGRRLDDVSPDFDDAAEAVTLWEAAEITLRAPGFGSTWQVPLGEIDDLAQRLDRAALGQRAAVLAATRPYIEEVTTLGLRDQEVVPGNTMARFRRQRLRANLRLLVAAPFAFLGIPMNAMPAALVHALGRRPMAPVTRATVKLLAGVVLFPLAWGGWWWLLHYREVAHAWLLVVAGGPVCGLAMAHAVARWSRYRRAKIGWRQLSRNASALEELRARRAGVVEAVRAATPSWSESR